jgi:uncharacterized protein (DUF488 family)
LGYQAHTQATFLAVLAVHKVTLVIDVRQNPVSRKQGFSKKSLENSVQDCGIGYIHFPKLGTPTRIRRLYLSTRNAQNALEQYEKYLRSRTVYLRHLLKKVADEQFCLLCLESDYNSCHRGIIARMLTEMTGCQPIHLH